MEPQEIMDMIVKPPGVGEMTLREYFRQCLMELWREGDRFSGKRPLGYSNWEFDIYAALVRDGWVMGSQGYDGELVIFDNEERKKADLLIEYAIEAM